MRKKFLSVVLTAMCLAFAACGGNGEPTEESKQTGTTQEEEKKESTQDKTEESTTADKDEIKELYSKVAFPPRYEVYVNYNRHYYEDTGDNCICFYERDGGIFRLFRYYVPEGSLADYAFPGSPEDAFDLLNDGKPFVAANCHAKRANIYTDDIIKIEVDSSENIKVNDLETFHFKGHATYTRYGDDKYYATGYTFIIDDRPYMLVGLIFGDEGDEDAHASLDEEIDIMMTTVRTEE